MMRPIDVLLIANSPGSKVLPSFLGFVPAKSKSSAYCMRMDLARHFVVCEEIRSFGIDENERLFTIARHFGKLLRSLGERLEGYALSYTRYSTLRRFL